MVNAPRKTGRASSKPRSRRTRERRLPRATERPRRSRRARHPFDPSLTWAAESPWSPSRVVPEPGVPLTPVRGGPGTAAAPRAARHIPKLTDLARHVASTVDRGPGRVPREVQTMMSEAYVERNMLQIMARHHQAMKNGDDPVAYRNIPAGSSDRRAVNRYFEQFTLPKRLMAMLNAARMADETAEDPATAMLYVDVLGWMAEADGRPLLGPEFTEAVQQALHTVRRQYYSPDEVILVRDTAILGALLGRALRRGAVPIDHLRIAMQALVMLARRAGVRISFEAVINVLVHERGALVDRATGAVSDQLTYDQLSSQITDLIIMKTNLGLS